MKLKYNLLSIIAVFFIVFQLFSCKKTLKTFEKDSISFVLPKDWKIGEIDSSDASFFFMAIGKEGHGASSDAFVEWNEGEFPLDTVMKITQEGYLGEKIFLDGNIRFSESIYETYNNYKALTATFEVTLLDVKNIGKIHCFYIENCDKTVMVAYQQVADDAKKQNDDYSLIEKSFTCKN